MKTITHDGALWKVQATGARRDGKVFCHLAHMSEGRMQRNGWVPMQICDWVDESVIEAAPAEYSNGPVSNGGMDPRN